jgi:hypothetical protein
MANFMFNNAKLLQATTGLNWVAGTPKVGLVRSDSVLAGGNPSNAIKDATSLTTINTADGGTILWYPSFEPGSTNYIALGTHGASNPGGGANAIPLTANNSVHSSVALISGKTIVGALYFMDVGGTDATRIPYFWFDISPAISPSNSTITVRPPGGTLVTLA